jgi:hypothetical protein
MLRVKIIEKRERSKGKAKNEEQLQAVPSSYGPFGTSETVGH